MDVFLTIAFVLGIVLTVVTLVGHGIWVLVAKLVGGSSRDVGGRGREPVRQICPRCRCASVLSGRNCPVCSWPAHSPVSSSAESYFTRSAQALESLQQQLEQLSALGLIDSETARQVQATLKARRQRLHEQWSAAARGEVLETPEQKSKPAESLPPSPQKAAPLPAPSDSPTDEVEVVDAEEAGAANPATSAKPETPEEAVRRRAELFAARTRVAREEVEDRGSEGPAATVDEPAEARPERTKESVPVSRLLSAFMEERNLRWGELVGGLLIVGCSIALVISFWSEIAERPFLKFFVFNGVTAALFAAGIYADRRLKLPTTGQGLLVTSATLVPLNFLAIASLTTGADQLALTLGGEALSIGIFAALLWYSGPLLVGELHRLLTVGVLLPSGMTLLTRRLVDAQTSPWTLAALALATLASYVGLSVRAIYKSTPSEEAPPSSDSSNSDSESRSESGSESESPLPARDGDAMEDAPESDSADDLSENAKGNAGGQTQTDELAVNLLFKWFGIVSFACLLPLGLLLMRTGQPWQTTRVLAPLLVLLGAPSLMLGVWVWQHVHDRLLATLRTAGMGVGVLGAGVMLSGLPIAWPNPAAIASTAGLNTIVFAAIGWILSLRPAHYIASACLGIAWTITGQVLLDRIAWQGITGERLVEQFLSAATGWILFPLTLLLSAIAWGWRRFDERHAPACYLRAAAGAAILSLGIASVYGWGRAGDPHELSWMYLIYGVAAASFALQANQRYAAWAASGLLLASAIQALVFRLEPASRLTQLGLYLPSALQVHSSVVLALGWAARRIHGRDVPDNVAPQSAAFALGASAVITLAVATCLVPVTLVAATPAMAGLLLAWMTVLAIAAAMLLALPQLGAVAQLYSAAATCLAVIALFANTTGATTLAVTWTQPRLWAAIGIGLAGWSAVLLLLRVLADRAPRLVSARKLHRPLADVRYYFHSAWSAVDSLIWSVAVALLVLLATYAVAPGIAQEFAPRPADADRRVVTPIERFELSIDDVQVSHQEASSLLSWLLLVTVVVAGVAGLPLTRFRARLPLLFVTTWCAIPLAASAWRDEVAVGSSLRWGLALGLLAGSALLWNRRMVRAWLPDSLQAALRRSDLGTSNALRATLLVLAFGPLLAMGAYVLAAALSILQLPPALAGLQTTLLIWTVTGLLVVAPIHFASSRIPAWQSSGFRRTAITALGLLISLGPGVTGTLYFVAVALRERPLTSPEPDSLFVTMGLAASYAIPLFVMTVALVGTAIRERSQAYAFGGALMLHLAATSGFLLLLANLGQPLDLVAWMRVAQLNACVAAVFAAPWSATVLRRLHRDPTSKHSPLLVALLGFAAALCFTHLVVPAVLLFLRPAIPRLPGEISHWSGWLSGGLTLAVIAYYLARNSWSRLYDLRWHLLSASLPGLALLIVSAVSSYDTGNWLAYHTLEVLWLGVTTVLLAGGIYHARFTPVDQPQPQATARPSRLAVTAMVVVGLLLAHRAFGQAVVGKWWGACGLFVVSLQTAGLACWSAHRRYAYVSALLLNYTATISVMQWRTIAWELDDLVYVNVIAAAVPCLLWLLLERRVFRPAEADRRRVAWMGVHRPAAAFALGFMVLLTGLGLSLDMAGQGEPAPTALVLAALVAVSQAVLINLWDVQARRVLFALYLTGLLALAVLLDSFNLSGELLHWTGTIFAAAYALATSFVMNRRRTLVRSLQQFHAPITHRRCRVAQRWIIPVNVLVAMFVVSMAFWASFTFDVFTFRFTAAQAALFQALSIGLLAFGTRRSLLQLLSLLVGLLAAIPFSWVWVPPDMEAVWLHRLAAFLVAMVAMSLLYSVVLVKLQRRESEWTRAAQSVVQLAALLSVAAIAGLLIREFQDFQLGQAAPLHPVALGLTMATLASLIVAAIVAAVVPGRDPLKLTEEQRSYYIYAAELLIALLVAHLRMTVPWLFGGIFQQFWPLVVVVIAFVGVGLAEFFRRRRQTVLSRPLERTGVLLPILPVLAFWVTPDIRLDYSVLMMLVGVFYAVLSVARRSFGFAVAAIAAANVSLWHLLHRVEGLSLTEHPQLWIIPPAACVLVATHLNARQLGAERVTLIRYLAATFIYASSTADIFLNGVANAPWLPIVLAGISIAGIFAGIWLRIRAFLYLGLAFLLIALLAVIWYAAVDLEQTWVWWVSGIVSGILIIALFALFENQRERLLKVVDDLKEWG